MWRGVGGGQTGSALLLYFLSSTFPALYWLMSWRLHAHVDRHSCNFSSDVSWPSTNTSCYLFIFVFSGRHVSTLSAGWSFYCHPHWTDLTWGSFSLRLSHQNIHLAPPVFLDIYFFHEPTLKRASAVCQPYLTYLFSEAFHWAMQLVINYVEFHCGSCFRSVCVVPVGAGNAAKIRYVMNSCQKKQTAHTKTNDRFAHLGLAVSAHVWPAELESQDHGAPRAVYHPDPVVCSLGLVRSCFDWWTSHTDAPALKIKHTVEMCMIFYRRIICRWSQELHTLL